MNRLTCIPGKELFELHDPETIQKYLWEMHKAWMRYLSEDIDGEDPSPRLFFFELLWNLLAESIPSQSHSKNQNSNS